MRYIFSLALFLNMLHSCQSAISQNGDIPNLKKYLALGDSYTIGESVRASETYPQQLVNALNGKEQDQFASPTIIARTGWTTGDLLEAINNAKIKGNKYDMVSLLIGVNNQFQGRSEREFEKEFGKLLDLAIGFAKDKKSVFVLSIPDYGFTPFGKNDQASISAEIDRFNEIISKISLEKGIRYIDITPISRKGLSDPELVANDGLHPSWKMYGEFVKLINDNN